MLLGRRNAQGPLGDRDSAALGGIEHRAGKRREGCACEVGFDNSATGAQAAVPPWSSSSCLMCSTTVEGDNLRSRAAARNPRSVRTARKVLA